MRRFLALLNIGAFLATLVVNTLANALPLNGLTTRELAERYPTMFLPAGYSFSVWGALYLGLGLLVLYQAGFTTVNKGEPRKVVDCIGYLFLLSSVQNIGWIVAWHYEQVILSLFFMLGLLLTLAIIYRRLLGRQGVSPVERRFVHIPISAYTSWIFTLSIANVAVALISRGWEGSGLSLETWTVTGLVVVGVVTWTLLTKYKDIWFALVSVWAAAGALVRHIVDLDGRYPRIMVWLGVSIILVLAQVVLTVTARARSHNT